MCHFFHYQHFDNLSESIQSIKQSEMCDCLHLFTLNNEQGMWGYSPYEI